MFYSLRGQQPSSCISLNCEAERVYGYHPDYLGHACPERRAELVEARRRVELVTDRSGFAYQYFYYAPFGDVLIEQNVVYGTFDSRWTFNGKEIDKETGLGYYGARYYDVDWSGPALSVVEGWLSVDPLAHLSPNQTPFHFVSNNPISRIDPDGRNDGEWERDANGEWKKTSPKGDEMGLDYYHYDNPDGTQTTEVRDKEGNCNTITNGRKILQGESRGSDVDWKQIYRDWQEGVGPERSIIEGDHPMNQEISESGSLGLAYFDFVLGGEEKDRYNSSFGIGGLIAAGCNMQAQMMGSYSVSFYQLGDKTLVIVLDSKTRQSFYYQLPGIQNYSRGLGSPSVTGLGMKQTTTYQTYIFFR